MKTAAILAFLLLLLWPPVGNHAAFAADGAVARKPVILLDSGHNPPRGGATSIRGINEVEYNDRFVGELAKALKKAFFHVELTRLPEETTGLHQRAELANQMKPDLFLSVHHDSAQLVYLEKIDINGVTAYRTTGKIAGYSIFVSRDNAQFEQSLFFAEQLGQHLLELGRGPTLHHAENIEGEGYELLDERLGIYRSSFVVLKNTEVPAVLLEVGVIVDDDDETYVSNPQNRRLMIEAIVNAIRSTIAEVTSPRD